MLTGWLTGYRYSPLAVVGALAVGVVLGWWIAP